MARYRITEEGSTVSIGLTEVEGKQEQLVEAFTECREGRCSCPTDEYEKLAALDLQRENNQITLRLDASPGMAFDTSEIVTCLDYTVGEVERRTAGP